VCYLLIKHESEFGEQICSNTLQQTNRQTNRPWQAHKSLKNKAKQTKGIEFKNVCSKVRLAQNSPHFPGQR